MVALRRTAPATGENRPHGLTQFLIEVASPGIRVRPIVNLAGLHDFNEVVFDDVFVPDDHLIGQVDMAWKQATDELAYERSGPERFLETIGALRGLVGAVGTATDDRVAPGIGRAVAHLQTLRRLSVSVEGMLHAGNSPVVDARSEERRYGQALGSNGET